MERFEAIAADGRGRNTTGGNLSNSWGGHQTRVSRHQDGSVRVLYIRSAAGGLVNWRLMKRPAGVTAQWTEEANGISTDDVFLVRDPLSDRAHVLAWPSSRPTVYTSPSFAPSALPGTWQTLSYTSPHYSGFGIGPDGTACLKVTKDNPLTAPTTTTETQFICGRYDASKSVWTWAPQQSKAIGYRYAYDFIFPGATGTTLGFGAVATRDISKTAAAAPNLSSAYVFNGVRWYTSGTSSTTDWKQTDTVVAAALAPTATAARTERLRDAFVDSKKRTFSNYWIEGPTSADARAHGIVVNDERGALLYKSTWSTLPTHGFVRMFEDQQRRLWLLWTAQGPTSSTMKLYPVTEGGPTLSFSLGTPIDLSSALGKYSVQGNPHIAVPRGGQAVGNAVDGTLMACNATYNVAGALTQCETTDVDRMRVFHFRIRLPG